MQCNFHIVLVVNRDLRIIEFLLYISTWYGKSAQVNGRWIASKQRVCLCDPERGVVVVEHSRPATVVVCRLGVSMQVHYDAYWSAFASVDDRSIDRFGKDIRGMESEREIEHFEGDVRCISQCYYPWVISFSAWRMCLNARGRERDAQVLLTNHWTRGSHEMQAKLTTNSSFFMEAYNHQVYYY